MNLELRRFNKLFDKIRTRRALVISFFSAIPLVLPQPSQASWSAYQYAEGNLHYYSFWGQKTYISSPSCAALGNNQFVCAYRGTRNWYNSGSANNAATIRINYFDGATWRVAVDTYDQSSFSSTPSCAGDGDKGAVCVAKGTDSALWAITSSAGSWGQFRKIGGAMASEPNCAHDGLGSAFGPGSIYCAYVGIDSAVYVYRFHGATWSGPQNLGGFVTSRPSCTGNGWGQIFCAVRGTDSALYVNQFSGSGWSSGFRRLGGLITTDPSCTRNRAGRIFCAAGGPNSNLQVNTFNEVTWTWGEFQDLGGILTSNPSCTEDGAGQVFCAVRGTNGALSVNQFTGTRWSGFQNAAEPDPLLFEPSCAGDGINPAKCGVILERYDRFIYDGAPSDVDMYETTGPIQPSNWFYY